MASKGWSKRFDEPIVLDDGTTLRTLQQAIQYLAKTVPKAEHDHPKVINAANHSPVQPKKLSHVLCPRCDATGHSLE